MSVASNFKLFGRTGGYYLFWTGAVYLVAGLSCAFYFRDFPAEYIQAVWLLVLALPFIVPPVGRYFNLDVEWDRKMFGWRKRQIAEQVAKDIDDLPETPEVAEVEEPKEKFDATEATYTIGKNQAGNIQLRMKLEHGSASLTMAPEAVVELIEQLAVNIRKQYYVEISELAVEEQSNEVD
jgi:hypothetical protein